VPHATSPWFSVCSMNSLNVPQRIRLMPDPKAEDAKVEQEKKRLDKQSAEVLQRYAAIHREVLAVAEHYRRLPKRGT
jgi:hypothetical protein